MSNCKNCSRPLKEDSGKCPYCGFDNEINAGPQNETGLIPAKENPPGITAGMKTLLMLLSVFIAPAGIIAGAVYMSKDSKESRALGRNMLIASVISLTLSIICCCASYMFFVNNYFTDFIDTFNV